MKYPTLWLAGLLALTASCSRNDPSPAVSADFTAPANPQATEVLQFQSTSQDAASYAWSFGDGTADKTANPTHTYAKPGTYQVTLRTYGTHQDSAKTTQSLVVGKYDVFAHATIKIAGTYDCTVNNVYQVLPPFGVAPPGVVTPLPSATLIVSKIGPDSIRVNNMVGYLSSEKTTGEYLFQMRAGNVGYAHFYTTGDSLRFTVYYYLGRASSTEVYRGRRRP